MLSRIVSAGVMGVDAYRVEVEADVARALPSFAVVGLPDGAVKESRDRVRAAMKNSGFAFPAQRVTINLAPADVKKEGSSFDLPMALAVLSADPDMGLTDLERCMVVGELSLDGSVRTVRGVLPVAVEAKRLGLDALVVPRGNCAEAAVVPGLTVYAADSLSQLVEGLRNGGLKPVEGRGQSLFEATRPDLVDFSEVRGQAHAKRALEIAAAGAHNVLMGCSPA